MPGGAASTNKACATHFGPLCEQWVFGGGLLVEAHDRGRVRQRYGNALAKLASA